MAATVERRSARAILIDAHGRLVLIKRSRPGQAPYWTAPGGGVEPEDASVEAALHRELSEELGATIASAVQVFQYSSRSERGVDVQDFFVARLVRVDDASRSGPEFDDVARGGYELGRIDPRVELEAIDLKPDALKAFIGANWDALRDEVCASPLRFRREGG